MKGHHLMRKLIEYTLVSVDGVYTGAAVAAFAEYRDEAYLRDGLGQSLSIDSWQPPRGVAAGRRCLVGASTI